MKSFDSRAWLLFTHSRKIGFYLNNHCSVFFPWPKKDISLVLENLLSRCLHCLSYIFIHHFLGLAFSLDYNLCRSLFFFFLLFTCVLINYQLDAVQGHLRWESKLRAWTAQVDLWACLWETVLLIGTGGPSPVWEAPFCSQVALTSLGKLVKQEVESIAPPWLLLQVLLEFLPWWTITWNLLLARGFFFF